MKYRAFIGIEVEANNEIEAREKVYEKLNEVTNFDLEELK